MSEEATKSGTKLQILDKKHWVTLELPARLQLPFMDAFGIFQPHSLGGCTWEGETRRITVYVPAEREQELYEFLYSFCQEHKIALEE